MEMIYVKPADGGRVRQPERQSRVMPPEGGYVPRDAHYERLLATGDVIETPPPAEAAPAKSEQLKNSTSAGSRRAPGASED